MTVSTQFLDLSHRDGWMRALTSVGERDLYFLPDWHQAFADYTGGEAMLYVYENQGDTLVYPFLCHHIPASCSSRYIDIEGVYGYSGPLATTSNPKFLAQAWSSFDRWCQDQHVVSEFTRFHPLIGNHKFAHPDMSLTLDRKTIAIDLSGGEAAILARSTSEQRNRLKKARSVGLRCLDITSHSDRLPQFLKIYRETMNHVAADDFYRFDISHLRNLISMSDAEWRFYAISDGDEMIAVAIFAIVGSRIHYHLGGSCVRYRDRYPNNLLFHQAAVFASEFGLKALHLGGGRTNAPDDGLFRFKKKFVRDASHHTPFFIGKRVHDTRAYEAITAEKIVQKGLQKRPQKLQFYRDC